MEEGNIGGIILVSRQMTVISDSDLGDSNGSDSDTGDNVSDWDRYEREHGNQHPNNKHLHAKSSQTLRPPMSPVKIFTFWSEYIMDGIYFDSKSFNMSGLDLPMSIDMLTSGTIVSVPDPNGGGFLKDQVTIDEEQKQPSDPTQAMV